MKYNTTVSYLILGLSVLAASSVPAVTIFDDTFNSGSTLTNPVPAAPTANSANYSLISSKTWVPAPSMSSGDFKFGINSTTSGHIEAQAIFSPTPVALSTVGDWVSLSVTFTDTSGILTSGAGFLGYGLYNSGGVAPSTAGMNGTATSSTTISGGTQNWQGYDARLTFTGGNNRIATRPMQVATTAINQDLVTEGSGSQSYANGVNLNTVVSTNTLAPGTTYTMNLIFTLTASGTFVITNQLYVGSSILSPLLYEQAATATGANFLTNSFDSMAVGYRAGAANAGGYVFDISEIKVLGQVAPVPEPATFALAGLGILGLVIARRSRS